MPAHRAGTACRDWFGWRAGADASGVNVLRQSSVSTMLLVAGWELGSQGLRSQEGAEGEDRSGGPWGSCPDGEPL